MSMQPDQGLYSESCKHTTARYSYMYQSKLVIQVLGKSGMATTGMTSIFPYPQRMLAGKGRDHSSSLLGQPGSRLASA